MNKSSAAPSSLYVVATPIGNLGDIGARALEVLATVQLVLAEDTRRSATLMQHFGIATPLRSLHDHNETQRVEFVLAELALGRSLALISDAGTPLINDPGYVLVRAVQAAGHAVVPVPGPSAIITALSAAGMATDRFCFEGFLPARAAARRERLQALSQESRTLVCYESPQRVVAVVKDMAMVFGAAREAAVARELTKLHEQIRRAPLAELVESFEAGTIPARGEFVLMVAAAPPPAADVAAVAADTERWLRALLAVLPPAELARAAARATGAPRAALYRRVLELNGK